MTECPLWGEEATQKNNKQKERFIMCRSKAQGGRRCSGGQNGSSFKTEPITTYNFSEQMNTPIEDLSIESLTHLSSNPNTPESKQLELSQHPHPAVRGNLAFNPSVSPEVLRRLRYDIDANVSTLAFSRSKDAQTARIADAKSPETEPDILAVLATNDDEVVRHEVARNVSTPDEILYSMKDDAHPGIRKAILNAHNPYDSFERSPRSAQIVNLFVDDKSEDVRQSVAESPNATAESLARLTNDPSSKVRESVKRFGPNNSDYKALREEIATDIGASTDLPDEWREQLIDAEIANRYSNS